MSGRTPINITSQTVYTNVDLTDDLFNVFAAASLLLGNGILADDAIAMSGLARFRAPSTIDDGLTLDDTVTLVNASVLTQNGDLTLGQSASDAATVRNIAGATWDLADGADITGAGSSQFVNLGLLELTAGTATIDANFYDRGGTIETSGTLDFASAGKVNRFVDDTITGAGTFKVDDGGVLVGSTVSAAIVELQDARIVGNVTISPELFTSNYLNLGAGSVLTFPNSWEGVFFDDEIIGAGAIELHGQSQYDYLGIPKVLVGDVDFINDGVVMTSDVDTSTKPWADDTVTIENAADGSWTDGTGRGGSSSYAAAGSAGASLFLNDGTFTENSNGATFNLPVENNGTMVVGLWAPFAQPSGSSLAFGDAVTGNGTMDVGWGSVIFGGSVASGQTVDFNGSIPQATPTLGLNDLADFAGTITNFARDGALTDEIEVGGAWSYQDFAPNSDNTGGALMFTNGSAETAVNLTGTYDPLGFHAAVSGSTTTITYTG